MRGKTTQDDKRDDMAEKNQPPIIVGSAVSDSAEEKVEEPEASGATQRFPCSVMLREDGVDIWDPAETSFFISTCIYRPCRHWKSINSQPNLLGPQRL